MLLAVEGGGFFSSSASGYSKGLTLLLLGQKTEDKPMKITPWNQHQLEEDRESESNIQLASAKKGGLGRGCASFSCCGRVDNVLDSPSSPKVGPGTNQESLPEPLSVDENKDQTHSVVNHIDDDTIDSGENVVTVESSSKELNDGAPVDSTNGFTGDVTENDVNTVDCSSKLVGILRSSSQLVLENTTSVAENGQCSKNINGDGTLRENHDNCLVERKKVQWMDTIGGELFEVREFEMSDDSDDEFGLGNGKCECRIM